MNRRVCVGTAAGALMYWGADVGCLLSFPEDFIFANTYIFFDAFTGLKEDNEHAADPAGQHTSNSTQFRWVIEIPQHATVRRIDHFNGMRSQEFTWADVPGFGKSFQGRPRGVFPKREKRFRLLRIGIKKTSCHFCFVACRDEELQGTGVDIGHIDGDDQPAGNGPECESGEYAVQRTFDREHIVERIQMAWHILLLPAGSKHVIDEGREQVE